MSILERRFRKSLQKQLRRGCRGYPLSTIAYYGPDDQRASKVAVGIIRAKAKSLPSSGVGSRQNLTLGSTRLSIVKSSSSFASKRCVR